MNNLKTIIADIMGGKKSKKASNRKTTYTALLNTHTDITTTQVSSTRITQNFRLVWLDSCSDQTNNDDSVNTIKKLRQVVNAVEKFTDVDVCVEFMGDIEDEKILMISSGTLGQTIVPVIHDMVQISCIYIFCTDKARHEQWTKEWPKIKGVYTDITPICEALKQAAQECDQNSVFISFLKSTDGTSKKNLDTLQQSFMFTQILKETLLTIDFKKEHVNEFLAYCQEQFRGNTTELENVDKIEKEYIRHQPIWWYTYNCFLYSMLNRALRLMEVDLIIKMGFFIRDLHNHIVTLHTEQYRGKNDSESFTVYHGQGLSQTDFDHLMNTQGGLLSFNNFLFTNKDSDVSLKFARRTTATSNLVGVVFVMNIDPSISATSFANIENVGYSPGEKDILFSMHSVFRIEQVKQINEKNRLWQVDLTATSDNDPQLHALTKCIQKETKKSTGWYRLVPLMIKLGHFHKAEELYEILLEQITNESEKADLYHILGMVQEKQGQYIGATELYEQSIQIRRKILPRTHPDLIASYNNIGSVYDRMGEYCKALSYYEKVLEVKQKTLPTNHPSLGTSYNNMAGMFMNRGHYRKALSYYEKAFEIRQKTLPTDHPELATAYNNIGLAYYNMDEYSKALSYYKRALDIRQRSLPLDHPHIQSVRESIAIVKKKL